MATVLKAKRKRQLSIKWRLLLTFFSFTAAMLAALWLLQVVFLDEFYRGIKTREIRAASETVAKKAFSEDIAGVLEELVADNQICAMLLTTDGQVVASADTLPNCLIHRMTSLDLFILYNFAAENDGTFLARFNQEGGYGSFTMGKAPFDRLVKKPYYFDDRESIISVRLVEQGGSERVLLLDTTVSPVGATVQTLRIQLLMVTGVTLILSLVLAYFLSRHIAKPVMDISRAARQLSGGSYTPYAGRGGYREVLALDQTLTQAAADLEKVEQLRRELLANISHDLRTPLTMITGYAEVMRDLPGENTPENVQIIIDEANRLTELVNDLLDLSKLQAGVVTLSPAVFSFTALIQGILARYQKLTENKGVAFSFEGDGEAFVEADRTRLTQVVYNLINNALHYSGEEKSIRLRQSRADGWVKLEIIDNGEGISEEQLPLVWERYYKIDKVHRRSSLGTGLGLSIVQSVLVLHGAKYGVESKLGEGSNFWFSLPEADGTAEKT